MVIFFEENLVRGRGNTLAAQGRGVKSLLPATTIAQVCYNVSAMAEAEYITTSEAAQRSRLSKAHIVRLLQRGTIAGKRWGREWMVSATSLDQYLAANRKPGPKSIDK